MKKNYIILILLSLLFQIGFAQVLKKQTLSSHGSSHFVYANNKSYFMQQSLGQLSVINTYETNGFSLRQGYLQPISPSGISNGADTKLDATIFPNPFADNINIKFNEPVVDVVSVFLYDMLGRAVLSKTYNPEETINIRLDQLASGPYILRVKMRSQQLVANLIRR